MTDPTVRLVDRLRERLRTTIQRIELAEATFGLVLTLGVLAIAWLLSATIEAGLWLSPLSRSVLIGFVAVLAAGSCAYFLLPPLMRLAGLLARPSEERIARRVGKHYPEVSDRLVNALQLADGRGSHGPQGMIDRAVRSLSEEVQTVEFERIENFGRARQASRLASLPIIGLLVFLLAAPNTFLDASKRLLSPRTPFARPAPFQLRVAPGDTDLVRGDSLQITVRAAGQQLPEIVTLSTSYEGEDAVDEVTLRADSTGAFRHTLVNVRQSMQYRVEATPVQSRWYAARVEARPLVRTLQVTLTPPAYTNLPTRRLDANVGDVTGLPGTRVDLEVGLGRPTVDTARIAFDDGSRDTLALQSNTASGHFTLQREGTYRILLRNAQGVSNRDPIEYAMKLRSDARPSVVFLAPDALADLPESLEQDLRLRVNDDFGIARLRLYYRVSERRFGQADSSFEAFDLPIEDGRQLDQQINYRWHLQQKSNLDLAPGDVVEYYARVWDNDVVAGYKSSRTETQRLRLPSLAEKYEALDEQQNAAEQHMESLMQETESIREQFGELRNELRNTQEADWEDQRQLNRLQERQQQLESNVEQLSQRMEEVTRQMEESDLANPETVELYQELQSVIQEVNSPELMQALEKLQQSLQDLDLGQMQQALEDFEFNEQQYQERLQRSLDLLKRIRVQQKLDEAARRAEALRQQEEQIAAETQQRQEQQESSAPDAEEAAAQSESEDGTGQDDAETKREASEQQSGDTRQASEQQQNGEQQPSESERQRPSEQNANEDLAREQERASEQMRALEEQLEQLRGQMEEVQSSPKQSLQQLMQEMEQQNLPQQMKQNSQQLRRNELQQARQGQKQMQQQLQQMQQRLQQMNQGMQGQQSQMNLAGLRQALDNTLLLSHNQERLRHRVGELSTGSSTLRELAQRQVALSEGLHTVSDSLQQLARKIPQMTRAVQRETGGALREMSQATSALSERKSRTASGHQRGSMMHLNELALLLSDLLDQMMQGQGSGSGMSMQQMLQQLQNMSGNQQQLNQQVQKFLNDMQGNRLNVDQQQRLQQLARQQQAIKRQLDELGRESGLRDQVLGDLNKITQQMEETIRELQENRQSPRTVERQRQILTRLLNAQKSLQQQGREEQRKSQQPEREFDRESPGELTREEQIDRLRRDLIRALETGYSSDYEELIKRYFELLQEQE